MLKSAECSVKFLLYYNQTTALPSQLSLTNKMPEFEVIDEVEEVVEEIIGILGPKIELKKLNVHSLHKSDLGNKKLKGEFKILQHVLFCLVHGAVKHNVDWGDVVLAIDLEMVEESQEETLVVEVMSTCQEIKDGA